jgi:hypothetical protein
MSSNTVNLCFDAAFVLVTIAAFFLGIKVAKINLKRLDEHLDQIEKEKKARETNAHS